MNEKTPNTQNKDDPRLYALTTLLNLEKRMRWASRAEARFIAVNETKELVDYTQCILWEAENGAISKGFVSALSNTAVIDKNAPFVLFMKSIIKNLAKNFDLSQPQSFKKSAIQDAELVKDWDEWFSPHIFWHPLNSKHTTWQGGLIFIRKQPWSEGEKNLVAKLSDTFVHSFSEHHKYDRLDWKKYLKDKKKLSLIAIFLTFLFFFPFRVSVLAPAEIIAKDPSLIRAPLDGIVETVHVKPNDRVNQGDVLITFDQAELEARLDVTKNAVNVAQTELRQLSQEAMGDSAVMSRIAAAQGRLEKEKAELLYVQDLLSRTQLKAPSNGVVVFEDAYDWLGRPVTIGERIMLLADPDKTELEIKLDIHDRIALPDNAEIRFFSNAAPHKPYDAVLSYVSYRASKTSDDLMAYRLKGVWEKPKFDMRLGQKGTAKIYGYRRPLIWQILRTPFTKMRQWLGI